MALVSVGYAPEASMASLTERVWAPWAGFRLQPWPPAILWVPAVAVALSMLLPVWYLVLRATGGGWQAIELATSARAIQLLVQSAALAVVVTAAASALGVVLGWLILRTDLPFHRMWAVVLVLPLVIPTYVGGFAYVAALGPRGLLQQMLHPIFGVERLPEIYGFWGAAFVLAIFTYPYVLLSVSGALARLDTRFEQASRSLGFGPWQTFARVTVPLLRPAVGAGALLVCLYTLSDFGAVSLLQFDSLTRGIYVQYQASFDRTMAAVLALLLMLITGVALLLEGKTRGRGKYYHSASGVPEAPARLPLGRLRWAALGVCTLAAFLGVGLPLGVLTYWLVRGLPVLAGASLVWTAVGNSALASGLAALITVVLAVPVAVLAVRYSGALSATIERITYGAFALPGIVVALALIFFSANYVPIIYQTVALLAFAYLVRFLPEAVGCVRAALGQVSPRVEEAARSLGRSAQQVLLSVTLPLVWPGVMAGAALVFLSAMKELPVTLLLSPIGFRTLATTAWGAATDGLFAQAALPSLVLVLVSGVSLFFLLNQGIQAGDDR